MTGGAVALFLSKFVNRVDKKGRVSVPAQFRAALSGQNFDGIVARPSFVVAALDGCGMDFLEELRRSLGQFNPFSDEHAGFANAIFAASRPLPWDSEGRVMLPDDLVEFAGLTDRAQFVGLGDTFQIWNPDAYATIEGEALALAREQRANLKFVPPGGES